MSPSRGWVSVVEACENVSHSDWCFSWYCVTVAVAIAVAVVLVVFLGHAWQRNVYLGVPDVYVRRR